MGKTSNQLKIRVYRRQAPANTPLWNELVASLRRKLREQYHIQRSFYGAAF
jgi:hypothetical protein